MILFLLCIAYVSDIVKAIDILNHAALNGASGTKDSNSRFNTLFLKISSPPSQTITPDFVTKLCDAIELDDCEPVFSGRGNKSMTMTLHCHSLNNQPRMSAMERKPLPTLPHTMEFIQTKSYVVDDYEYLGEYRKPTFWYGNYESTDQAMRLYFERMNQRFNAPTSSEEGEDEEWLNTASGGRRANKTRQSMVHGKFVEHMAPWGLDRIDMRFGLLNNEYTYDNLGENIDIFVIDTGVRPTHNEFQGRVSLLINTVGDNVNGDCVGHGTHVASIAAGVTYGVAKGAKIWSVKALGCDGGGNTYTIVTGIMAIIEHVSQHSQPGRRAVASFSLGGDFSIAINNAILSLVNAGIPTIVAAGNEYSDACNYSPATMGNNAGVLTVGASNVNDARPAWSNYGACVGITAPGAEIIGAYATSDSASQVLSGTSMATPFVTGVVALLLNQNTALSVSEVKKFIQNWATQSVITGTSINGGGKNLLYSLIVSSEQTPPNLPGPVIPITTPPSTFLLTPAPTQIVKSNAPKSLTYSSAILSFIMLLYISI